MAENSDVGRHQPMCNLAHALVNKLSVIVGSCDLLMVEMSGNATCFPRLETIRGVARSMAEELNRHQCDLDVLAREVKQRQSASHNGKAQQLLSV